MPYQHDAVVVLQNWRDVERQIEESRADSPDLEELQADAAELRDQYQRLVAAARDAHRPVPPPFPSVPQRTEP